MLQVAVDAGAHVTAVCSAGNASVVSTLGASRVIDYACVDFTGEGIRYDVIVDTVGNAPYARSKRALGERGRLLLVLATLPELLRAPWVTLTTPHRVIAGPAAERIADLRTIAHMAETGRFTPLIDSCLPFSQIVQAHARVESGRKRGSVVVQFDALSPGGVASLRDAGTDVLRYAVIAAELRSPIATAMAAMKIEDAVLPSSTWADSSGRTTRLRP